MALDGDGGWMGRDADRDCMGMCAVGFGVIWKCGGAWDGRC